MNVDKLCFILAIAICLCPLTVGLTIAQETPGMNSRLDQQPFASILELMAIHSNWPTGVSCVPMLPTTCRLASLLHSVRTTG